MPTKVIRAVLGGRLRKARQDNQFTQEAVAAYCKVKRQTISGWERGDAAVDVSHLSELAMLYGQSTDYLIFGIRTAPVKDSATCQACPNASSIIRLVLAGK